MCLACSVVATLGVSDRIAGKKRCAPLGKPRGLFCAVPRRLGLRGDTRCRCFFRGAVKSRLSIVNSFPNAFCDSFLESNCALIRFGD